MSDDFSFDHVNDQLRYVRGMICNTFQVFADEFKVDRFYRFEGESNPSDSAILYAISSDKHNIKGVLVNAYGIYSEPVADEIMEKLQMRK